MAFVSAGTRLHLLFSRLRSRGLGREDALKLLLVAVTLVVYLRTCWFDFVSLDDPVFVTANEHVRNGLNLDGIRWAFASSYHSNWMPLTRLSHMLDATIYGPWAGGYHLTNVVLHVANVLLVFGLFRTATGYALRSAFVAALFAVHPLHVESVAWITERKDVLSLFFGLLSLSAYVRYAQTRRVTPYALSIVCFAGSLLSKQTLVTLPFVLLLLDYWPLNRLVSGLDDARTEAGHVDPGGWTWGRVEDVGRLFLEKLPFFVISAAFCIVALWAQSRGHSVRSFEELPLSTRAFNAILAYGLYLKHAVFPFGLAAYYPHPGSRLSMAQVAVAFVLLSGFTVVAIWNLRRWPFVFVGWLWYLGGLFPMIGLVQLGSQQMADRYAYFTLLGLYVAIAWLVPALVPDPTGHGRLLLTIAAGTVAVYAALAFLQVGYWRDGVTLMRRTVAVTADNPFARCALGYAYFVQSRIDEAIQQYRAAIKLAPEEATGHARLAYVLEKLKRFDDASATYRKAIAIDERDPATHNGLGAVLFAQHHYRGAEREFRRALELDANDAEVYANLSILYRALGEYSQSITYGQRALELEPTWLPCQRLIALDLRDEGRIDEAIDRFRSVVAASPGDAEARAQLGNLMARASRNTQPRGSMNQPADRKNGSESE
jgi:protein O-mannosyl-transferase